MAVMSYEIKENILSLPKERETDVYHKELNIVSWYGRPDKLDIRGWSDDHEKMTKGISLTEEEFMEIARKGMERLERESLDESNTADKNRTGSE